MTEQLSLVTENNTDSLPYRSGGHKSIGIAGLKMSKCRVLGLWFILKVLVENLFWLLETAHIPWFVAPSIFKASSGQWSLSHTASLSASLFHI